MMPLAGAVAYLPAAAATAQVFNGGGVQEGIDQASEVTGVTEDNPRTVIINVIRAVLDFTALLAVAMIILAGFYLVLSFGNDENKEKAKKIILYTVIGLLVILFARVIVSLITVWLASQV